MYRAVAARGYMRAILRTEADKVGACAHIAALPVGKHQYALEIKVNRRNRTLRANALYWMWLACIGRETGNDSEDIHDYCKQRWAVKVRITLGTLEATVSKSTTKLDTKEFAAYMDNVSAWARDELGIVLPTPRRDRLGTV